MRTLTRNAYAKINLTLDVGLRRPDGYHDIQSIMQTIELHDTLTLTQTPDLPGIRLSVIDEEAANVPADESNLVHRAAVRLQKIAAARGLVSGNRSGLALTLHKRVPSQAGLGGGSSDAAATLLAVNDLLGLALSTPRLTEIAATLGADVPFFLTGGTALAEGLGERITTLSPLTPPWPLVIVKPPTGVSTAAAYAAMDALADRQPGRATHVWLHADTRLSNDFEAVILPAYKEIATAYQILDKTDQTGESFRPLLCGSGSALFLRVSNYEIGRQVADRIETLSLGKAWVTATRGATE